MAAIQVQGMKEVQELLAKVKDYGLAGHQTSITLAARGIAEAVKDSIRSGEDSSGTPLTPLRESTLKGPIRVRDDNRIRGDFGDTPLHATGRLAEDIVAEKLNDKEWQIGAYTEYADKILRSNSKPTHTGIPFGGDTPKANRDVMIVSEKHLDIIENQIVSDLETLLGI